MPILFEIRSNLWDAYIPKDIGIIGSQVVSSQAKSNYYLTDYNETKAVAPSSPIIA